MVSDTPPCRACGKAEPVIEYHGDTPHLAICPDCCDKAEHPDGETGHKWEHDKWERDRVCQKCGIPRRCTEYANDD